MVNGQIKIQRKERTISKESSISQDFNLKGQNREVIEFEVKTIGRIDARAEWKGTARSLALILNGPGQTQAYARKDGGSPLSLSFDISQTLLSRGKKWKLSVVNFHSGTIAQGKVYINYTGAPVTVTPIVAPIRKQEKRPVSTALRERMSFDTRLKPQETFEFDVPLYTAGTLISVRFVPDDKQKLLGTPARLRIRPQRAGMPLTKADIEKSINNQIRQQRQRKGFLTFSLKVGARTYRPIENLGGYFDFVIQLHRIPINISSAKGMLTNLTGKSLNGKVLISSTDTVKRESLEKERRIQALNEAIMEFRNPDILWVFHHTLKRHLKGYPGGQSEIDSIISKNISNYRVSHNFLKILSEGIKPFETSIKRRIKNRTLTNLSIQQPVTKNLMSTFVKAPPPIPMSRETVYGEWLKGNSYSLKSSFFLSENVHYEVIKAEKAALLRGELENDWQFKNSKFKIVSGLGDSRYFSLECLNEPGYYIKTTTPGESPLPLIVSKKSDDLQFKKHATFKIVPALTGAPLPSVSIESYFYPEKFIQVSDSGGMFKQLLFLDKCRSDKGKKLATFILEGKLDILERYSIKLNGIYSHRCADDVGWEWGCDEEEPYVVWTCFGPDYWRSGRTENGQYVTKNDDYLFMEATNVLSASVNSTSCVTVGTPLFFIYKVCESDPGGPSTSDITDAMKSAVVAGLAGCLGRPEILLEQGIVTLLALADIFMKAAGKGDDLYPAYGMTYNSEEALLEHTSGSWPGWQNEQIFESEGRGDCMAHYLVPIKKGSKLQWTLSYLLFRERKR